MLRCAGGFPLHVDPSAWRDFASAAFRFFFFALLQQTLQAQISRRTGLVPLPPFPHSLCFSYLSLHFFVGPQLLLWLGVLQVECTHRVTLVQLVSATNSSY